MQILVSIVLTLLITTPTWAADDAGRVKEDKTQVREWNTFANDLLKLHKQLISRDGLVKTEKKGGYRGRNDFYNEITYRDAKTKKVVSRVQWELENPGNVHVIELFLYDDKGRLSHDYTAAFLENYRNAPNQTLVAAHSYNDGLHAFRTFDASGEAVNEICEGTYKGKSIDISLEDYEVEDMRRGITGGPDKANYKACFGKLGLTASAYLPPRK